MCLQEFFTSFTFFSCFASFGILLPYIFLTFAVFKLSLDVVLRIIMSSSQGEEPHANITLDNSSSEGEFSGFEHDALDVGAFETVKLLHVCFKN
jgi:hypothetical protein